MGWLTGSEIYPLAVRGARISAQAATLWTTNLLRVQRLLRDDQGGLDGDPIKECEPLRGSG